MAEGSSACNNFHGHVQHNAYHAGQINPAQESGAWLTTHIKALSNLLASTPLLQDSEDFL